ncbi:integrase [Archaeoglobales archaeon ex4484_92]|nr:MAG: integrase [Archaeoglobales archaeon ex4484_92]
MAIKGVSEGHLRDTATRLYDFAEWCSYQFNLNDIKIYISELKRNYSPSHIRKVIIDIRRLLKHLNHPLSDDIELPKTPKRRKIVIKVKYIQNLLSEVDNLPVRSMVLRTRAAILLTATSGLRAEELYKLRCSDIDIERRTVYIRPEVAKDREERVTFFSIEAQAAIKEFFDSYKPKSIYPFSESTLRKSFEKIASSMRMKHMRKFFSQQSDRLGMPTTVKKILMGHSLRGDVDLSYYDFQDEEELKKIYDKYWRDFRTNS